MSFTYRSETSSRLNAAIQAEGLEKWLRACPACRTPAALRKAGVDKPFDVLQCKNCGQVVLQLD